MSGGSVQGQPPSRGPLEGYGEEAGPRPSQGVTSVGEDWADDQGGRRWGADKCHTATMWLPKAGGSRPPCCPSPPQLFATKGPISSLASTLYGRGDKTT